MIQLPPGFNVLQLALDFRDIILPFVSIVSLISGGFLLLKILKRV